MELKSLRLFLSLSETCSFAETAKQSFTVQSNVTSHIKKLEQELGQQLFYRRGSVALTPAGRQLLSQAREILQLHETTVRSFANKAEPRGELRIGAMETTAATSLGRILSRYHEQYPQVDLRLETGPTLELKEKVMANKLDCALLSGQIKHSKVEMIPAFAEELVLVSGTPITSLPTCAELNSAPFMAFQQGCHYRHQIELFLESRGVHHVRIFEFGSINTILSCVSVNMGYALLPHRLIEIEKANYPIHYCKIPQRYSRVQTYLMAQSSSGWTPALSRFVDTVCQTSESSRKTRSDDSATKERQLWMQASNYAPNSQLRRHK